MKKGSNTISSVLKGLINIQAIKKGLITVYEAFKELIVSGIFPLVLNNSIGQDLVDYKIYGESVQNGTPSPDNPVEIQSVGDLVTDSTDSNYGKYRIPVKVSGKNLANPQNLINSGFTKQEDGSYYVEKSSVPQNKILYNNFSNKEGTYTISYYTKFDLYNNGVGCFIRVYYTDGTYDGVDVLNRATEYEKLVLTTSANKIVDYITWTYGVSYAKTYIKDVQIEEGNTVTEYEPYQGQEFNIYLDEPLRKVGNYSDYIDFKNKIVKRNVSKYSIVGTETMVYSQTTNNGYIYIITLPKADKTQTLIETYWTPYCSHLKGLSGNVSASNILLNCIRYAGGNYRQFNICVPYATLEEFKTWISENNVSIVFPLNKPTEETIELPNIPTLKGTTIIEVDTKIQPSNAEVIYMGKP